MYHLVLLFAAVALLGSTCKSATVNRQMKLLNEMNNDIDSNERPSPTKRFLHLTRTPAPRELRASELTCEAVGVPAPSIRWFKDNAPIYEYDKESHEVTDANPHSLARVSSTLLLAAAADGARYTCVATAGHLTARAHTTVYNAGATERTERARLVPLAPRILRYARVFADAIGGSTRLPCAARGHPRPTVRWTDADGRPVTDNPRMKVLRSGELVISELQWSDMGELTCTATNMFGSAHVNTFLYPARPSESDG